MLNSDGKIDSNRFRVIDSVSYRLLHYTPYYTLYYTVLYCATLYYTSLCQFLMDALCETNEVLKLPKSAFFDCALTVSAVIPKHDGL